MPFILRMALCVQPTSIKYHHGRHIGIQHELDSVDAVLEQLVETLVPGQILGARVRRLVQWG